MQWCCNYVHVISITLYSRGERWGTRDRRCTMIWVEKYDGHGKKDVQTVQEWWREYRGVPYLTPPSWRSDKWGGRLLKIRELRTITLAVLTRDAPSNPSRWYSFSTRSWDHCRYLVSCYPLQSNKHTFVSSLGRCKVHSKASSVRDKLEKGEEHTFVLSRRDLQRQTW